jgi:uncharacterized membrane protein
MNTKQRISLILTLIILMIAIIPLANTADSPIIQVSAENIYLTAGQENTIKIVLENTGDYKVFDIESFLSSSIPGITVITNANKVFPVIEADKAKNYEPTLYIDQNLNLGAYSLTLTVTYGRTDFIPQTITVPIGVVVSEVYKPKIVYSPTLETIDVKSGKINEVEFKFNNIWGKSLNNIEIVLSSTSNSITVHDSVNTVIGALEAGDSFTIKPSISIIEGTPLGPYTITASSSYMDEEGKRYHQMFSLPINIASAVAIRNTLVTIKEMKVVESSIRPGDIFTVELELTCTGADAYDLLSSMGFNQMSPLSPISPSIVSLGDIEVDQTKKATYRLLASGDISAGQYPVSATISYTSNKGISKDLTESLTILVDGLIDFELLDTPSDKVAPGETKELEADLLLIGTESVEFVSIGVVEDDVIKRVSGSDEYIGAVDPDSPIPFDVNYKVDEKAQDGSHELGLDVRYRDHLNKEHEEQIKLEIEIGGSVDDEPTKQQGGIWTWIRRLLGLGP